MVGGPSIIFCQYHESGKSQIAQDKQPGEPPYLHQVNLVYQVNKCTECEVNQKCGCDECKKVWNGCMQCAKNKPYKLLKTGMVGGPSIIFCQYHESGKSQIRNDAKPCAKVVGFNVNSLYLYC